jgi:hypothetical protein
MYADVTNPHRGFNTIAAKYELDPYSVMYLGDFSNDRTLIEQEDWAATLCAFGGPPTSECDTPLRLPVRPASVGTLSGVR